MPNRRKLAEMDAPAGKQVLTEPEDEMEVPTETQDLGDDQDDGDQVDVFGADDEQDLDSADSLDDEGDEEADLDSEVEFDDDDSDEEMGDGSPETLVKNLASAIAAILHYGNSDEMSEDEAMQEAVMHLLGEDASIVRRTMEQHAQRRAGSWQGSDFKDLAEDLEAATGDFYIPNGLDRRIKNDRLYYTIETTSQASGVKVVEITRMLKAQDRRSALSEARSENALWADRLSDVRDVDTENNIFEGLSRQHKIRTADELRTLASQMSGRANNFLFVSEDVRGGLGLTESRAADFNKMLSEADAASLAAKSGRKTHSMVNTDWANMYDAAIKQVHTGAFSSTKTAPARRGDKKNADKMQQVQDFLRQASSKQVATLWKASKGMKTATAVAKESIEYSFSNEVDALMNVSDSITEEMREQITIIFENAVVEKIEDTLPTVMTALESLKRKEVDTIQEALVSRIDTYLDYVVENFMKENEVAIDSGIQAEISESFLSGLHKLMESHYVEVPSEKVSMLESTNNRVDELETLLENEKQRSLGFKRRAVEKLRENTAYRLSRDLSDNETARLHRMLEDLEFSDEDEFIMKAKSLKETYFASRRPTSRIKDEDVATLVEQNEPTSTADGSSMNKYVTAIQKMNQK